MNNSDLSLDFLKECQKCRENGVPNDMAILAALQDLADWKDQHPRKGLWDSEKVISFLKEHATVENSSNINIHINGAYYHFINDFIENLRKAMED